MGCLYLWKFRELIKHYRIVQARTFKKNKTNVYNSLSGFRHETVSDDFMMTPQSNLSYTFYNDNIQCTLVMRVLVAEVSGPWFDSQLLPAVSCSSFSLIN